MPGSVGVFKNQVMEYKFKRADRGRAVAVMQSENSDSTSISRARAVIARVCRALLARLRIRAATRVSRNK